MICIECTHPVTTLYTSYSPTNLRLTACPSCNKFADKYIEYDRVLIFIDLLLLRPQAYRHVVFNVLAAPDTDTDTGAGSAETEKEKEKGGKTKRDSSLAKLVYRMVVPDKVARFIDTATNRLHLQLHPQTIRIWVLITLFDVYLTWARAEQQHQNPASTSASPPLLSPTSPNPLSRPSQFTFFLGLPVLAQYSTFLLFCMADSLVSHATIQGLARWWLGWRDAQALSTALVISSSSKLFPILMVIWSYDVPLAATVLGWAVSFNTIEALTIILGCGYPRAVVITVVAALSRIVVCEYGLLKVLQWAWTQLNF